MKGVWPVHFDIINLPLEYNIKVEELIAGLRRDGHHTRLLSEHLTREFSQIGAPIDR